MTRQYLDGYPANLPAAASDALWWLQQLRQNPDVCFRGLTEDERAKMGRCVDDLARFVGECGEEVFETSRRYPEAEVVIVASSKAKVPA